MTVPRFHPSLTAGFIALAAALAAPLAHAQWNVTDDQTHTILNDNLTTPGSTPASSWSGTTATDPTTAWHTELENITQECSSMVAAQQSICTEIGNTRNAYYQYMNTMYTTNRARYALLQNLIKARTSITNLGNLEANTNAIETLRTLIELDRQQTETVEHGYRMRIEYLAGELTQQSKNVTSGSGGSVSIGNVLSTLASGAVLQTTLQAMTPDTGPSLTIFSK